MFKILNSSRNFVKKKTSRKGSKKTVQNLMKNITKNETFSLIALKLIKRNISSKEIQINRLITHNIQMHFIAEFSQ